MARADPEDLWDGPTDYKKKIAIYGGGYTRRLIWDHPLVDDDCEIWTGNHVWKNGKDEWGEDCPRIDRYFDVHDTELLEGYRNEGDQKHFKWLQEEHDFPMFMQEPDERFPSATRYPFEEIVEEFFGRQDRGPELKAAFGSMMDFITAMAIYEGADWIGYFGVEMGSSTEHKYQIPYGHIWLGIAAGRKVTTWVPDDLRVQLLRQQVYAYEGFQMISRQTLEQLYYQYEKQRRKWVDASNTWIGAYRLAGGQLEEARENGHKPEEIEKYEAALLELGEKVRRARETSAMASGMMIATKHAIQVADNEEPDTEIYSTLFEDIPLEDLRP